VPDRRGERSSKCPLELVRSLHRGAEETDRSGDCREVGVVELGREVHDARGLHLQLHEREGPVVEHHDLDREMHLAKRDQLAEQYREPPSPDQVTT
jgi:hypothetical protein